MIRLTPHFHAPVSIIRPRGTRRIDVYSPKLQRRLQCFGEVIAACETQVDVTELHKALSQCQTRKFRAMINLNRPGIRGGRLV